MQGTDLKYRVTIVADADHRSSAGDCSSEMVGTGQPGILLYRKRLYFYINVKADINSQLSNSLDASAFREAYTTSGILRTAFALIPRIRGDSEQSTEYLTMMKLLLLLFTQNVDVVRIVHRIWKVVLDKELR